MAIMSLQFGEVYGRIDVPFEWRMSENTDHYPVLPAPVLGMWPAAKMLWLYLNLTGPVVASQRELSVALGLTQRTIGENVNKLHDRNLIQYEPSRDRSATSRIEVLDPIFLPLEDPLPPALKEAAVSTKLLYLWLLPQGEVTYTQKEIAANLGVTEMTAVKARHGLASVGAIGYLRRPGPRRHGIYYVLPPTHLQERRDIDTELALPEEIERGKGAELKLFWLIDQRGAVTAHQRTLAAMLDAPQSSISTAIRSLVEKGLIERASRGEEETLSISAGRSGRSALRAGTDVIPEELRGEANAVQLLYMWLKPQGEVTYSYSDIVELVRIRSHSVMKALGRLEGLGMLSVSERPTPHGKGRFKILR